MLPDWFIAASKRLAEQEPRPLLCDTEFLVQKHRADGAQRIGDVVMVRPVPAFNPNAQEAWDDFRAREIRRAMVLKSTDGV